MNEHEEQVRQGVEAATKCLRVKFPTATVDSEPGIGGSYRFHLRFPGQSTRVLQLSEGLLADYRTDESMMDTLAGRSVLNRLAAGETEVVA